MSNRETISRETRTLNRRFEEKYFPKVKAVLDAEKNSVINVVQEKGVQAAITYVNNHIHSKGLPAVIEALYKEVGLRYARRTWIDLTAQRRNARKSFTPISGGLELKGFGFNAQWVQFIKNFLYRFLIEKITFEVARTTREILLTTLNRSITEGWGVDETVKNLEELPFTRTQSARIVRTEITRATNTGIMAAGETYPWQQTKEWIAALDERTRGNPITGENDHANHWALDGVTIDREDYFTDPRNGDKLLFPGDPAASAGSVINCRCVIAVVTKVDQNGRLIPKQEPMQVLKEYVPDYTPVFENTELIKNDLKQHVSDLVHGIEDKFDNDELLNQMASISSEVSEKITNITQNIGSGNDELRADMNEAKNHLSVLMKTSDIKDEKRIDEVIRLINSKDYTPQINLQTDSADVINAVNKMRGELVSILTVLKDQLTKKRTFNHTVNYDKNDHILNIVSNER